MKVRGFQVAPAELEAHLLLNPYVADVCVVGVPDDYSGELPMAFIVPSAKALELVGKDPKKSEALKAAIAKVLPSVPPTGWQGANHNTSMLLMQRSIINIWLEESNLSMPFRRTHRERLYDPAISGVLTRLTRPLCSCDEF